MKRSVLIILMCLSLLALSGCSSAQTFDLTIVNNRSADLLGVRWANYLFGALSVGESRTIKVAAGSDYVYYSISTGGPNGSEYVTSSKVPVSANTTFVLTDSTPAMPLGF